MRAAAMAALGLAGCGDVQATRSAVPATVPAVSPGTEVPAGAAAFADGEFGVAARYFQMAMDRQPGLEACLGLAAAYDWLYRFSEADRTYAACEAIDGDSFAYHNNVGFSRLLRGQIAEARASFMAASALRPHHPVVETNLQILRDVAEG